MKLSIAVLVLAAFAWMPRAQAQSCALTSGTGVLVDFSAYTAVSGTVDAQGVLTLNCTTAAPLNLPVSYSISIGKGSSTSFNPRTLTFGAYALNYNLYTDLTRVIIWGDGTVPLTTSRKSGSCGGACSVFVYGRLPGGQSVPAGAYSDQVQVTLDF